MSTFLHVSFHFHCSIHCVNDWCVTMPSPLLHHICWLCGWLQLYFFHNNPTCIYRVRYQSFSQRSTLNEASEYIPAFLFSPRDLSVALIGIAILFITEFISGYDLCALMKHLESVTDQCSTRNNFDSCKHWFEYLLWNKHEVMKIKNSLQRVSDKHFFRSISQSINLWEDIVFLQVSSSQYSQITPCQNLTRNLALFDWKPLLKCHILHEMQSQTKMHNCSYHYRTLHSQQKIQPGLQHYGQSPGFVNTLWQWKLFFGFHCLQDIYAALLRIIRWKQVKWLLCFGTLKWIISK